MSQTIEQITEIAQRKKSEAEQLHQRRITGLNRLAADLQDSLRREQHRIETSIQKQRRYLALMMVATILIGAAVVTFVLLSPTYLNQ